MQLHVARAYNRTLNKSRVLGFGRKYLAFSSYVHSANQHCIDILLHRSCSSLACLQVWDLRKRPPRTCFICMLYVWSRYMLSQVLHLSITPLMCLALSQHDITPLFSALPFPLDIFQATRSIAPRCYKVVQ